MSPGPWEYRDNCVFSEGRCIDGEFAPGYGAVAGKVYEVDGIENGDGLLWLILSDVKPRAGHTNRFNSARFRKIRPDEPEACEEEFTILLKLSKQRVHGLGGVS